VTNEILASVKNKEVDLATHLMGKSGILQK
jgi:hypothetical protein